MTTIKRIKALALTAVLFTALVSCEETDIQYTASKASEGEVGSLSGEVDSGREFEEEGPTEIDTEE